MFVQNRIDLRAAVRELSCVQTKKNSDENKPVRCRYTADSNSNLYSPSKCKQQHKEEKKVNTKRKRMSKHNIPIMHMVTSILNCANWQMHAGLK